MRLPYITLVEWCQINDVPDSTARSWIKNGTIEVLSLNGKRPVLIREDHPVPYKDPDIHQWRYQWKEKSE